MDSAKGLQTGSVKDLPTGWATDLDSDSALPMGRVRASLWLTAMDSA